VSSQAAYSRSKRLALQKCSPHPALKTGRGSQRVSELAAEEDTLPSSQHDDLERSTPRYLVTQNGRIVPDRAKLDEYRLAAWRRRRV